MKKSLALFAFVTLFAANAFATYVVVLKDNTRYNAKQKWTIVNGKALILLESGQSVTVDPNFIDVAQSEKLTKLGITSAGIVDLNTNLPATTSTAPKTPSLGGIKLRTPQQQKAAAQQQQTSTPATTASTAGSGGTVSAAVIDKFERAYDNMSIFERRITSTGAHSLRAELTVDTEDRVFNAISATSLLMVRIDDARIDTVELFMKTGVGGSAGRFQMSRADAEALVNRTISQSDYFVRNVIY